MTETEKDLQLQARERSAMKRDLVPIIVILVFTIVMTVVAITMWHLLHQEEDKGQPFQVPDSASLLLRGENEFMQFQFSRAIISYKNALRSIRESENREQALIPFLIHLRLAEIYLRQNELELAEKHLDQTELLRERLEQELSGMQQKMRRQLKSARKAEEEENTGKQKTEVRP